MLTEKARLYVNGFRSKQFTRNGAMSEPRVGVKPQNHEAPLDDATADKPLDALLKAARRALCRREFAVAAAQLQKALDLAPGSPEAHTLRGLLHEALGQQHAAYHTYKTALRNDPGHGLALCLMRAYCDRFGLDFDNPCINPAAARL